MTHLVEKLPKQPIIFGLIKAIDEALIIVQ